MPHPSQLTFCSFPQISKGWYLCHFLRTTQDGQGASTIVFYWISGLPWLHYTRKHTNRCTVSGSLSPCHRHHLWRWPSLGWYRYIYASGNSGPFCIWCLTTRSTVKWAELEMLVVVEINSLDDGLSCDVDVGLEHHVPTSVWHNSCTHRQRSPSNLGY